MKLIWADEAAWALVDLEEQLVERYSARRAATIVTEIVERVDLLVDHPEMGRVVPEYGQWQLRELVDRWNRILYRLTPDAIEIVTIVPTRMMLPGQELERP